MDSAQKGYGKGLKELFLTLLHCSLEPRKYHEEKCQGVRIRANPSLRITNLDYRFTGNCPVICLL